MTVDLPGKQERLNFFKADGTSSKRQACSGDGSDDRDRLLDTAECCFNSVQNLASPHRITSRG